MGALFAAYALMIAYRIAGPIQPAWTGIVFAAALALLLAVWIAGTARSFWLAEQERDRPPRARAYFAAAYTLFYLNIGLFPFATFTPGGDFPQFAILGIMFAALLAGAIVKTRGKKLADEAAADRRV